MASPSVLILVICVFSLPFLVCITRGLFTYFFLFLAAPMAYGSSWIHPSKPKLQPTPQLWQCWVLQPTVSEGGLNLPLCSDWSCCSWILNLLCHSGNAGLFFFFFFLLSFLWLYLCHMGVPGLEVESELQLLAYTTATAILDLSLICKLCSSLP